MFPSKYVFRVSTIPKMSDPRKSLLLVGGFAANNWLFSELEEFSRAQDLQLYRPDGHL